MDQPDPTRGRVVAHPVFEYGFYTRGGTPAVSRPPVIASKRHDPRGGSLRPGAMLAHLTWPAGSHAHGLSASRRGSIGLLW